MKENYQKTELSKGLVPKVYSALAVAALSVGCVAAGRSDMYSMNRGNIEQTRLILVENPDLAKKSGDAYKLLETVVGVIGKDEVFSKAFTAEERDRFAFEHLKNMSIDQKLAYLSLSEQREALIAESEHKRKEQAVYNDTQAAAETQKKFLEAGANPESKEAKLIEALKKHNVGGK